MIESRPGLFALSGASNDRFDQDHLSQLLADGKAGVADLADEIIPAGKRENPGGR